MKNSKKMSIERYGFLAPRNAPFALELIADDKWRYIPGMIYVGDNDGLCALVYDANAAIPLAYTEKQPGEETGAMFLGGILADRDRGEKDHNFVNISKEQIRAAVKRVYKKGNTKDLILGPKNKKIRKYTYNEIKDLFDFPLSNNLQGGLFTVMTIKERIDYILENNPDIEHSIAALSPFKCFDIVKNSIKKSKEAFNAGKDLMIDHKSITRLTEIFYIDNYLELMLDLAIFLMKKSPNEVMGVVTNSPIMNSDFHVCLFLIYYIENRVLLPARIKKAPVERLARSARRVAISLNIAGIKLSSSIIDLLTSQFKANIGYFENILQYHTDLRELISNQTNNNKDYSLEIFKHYADFPIVFKQFMYAQFFSTDHKMEAYRRGDENSYNHGKNKILGLS